jgi:hypothetical protein
MYSYYMFQNFSLEPELQKGFSSPLAGYQRLIGVVVGLVWQDTNIHN